MKPLISVVSASWNQGRYLEECHQSIIGCEKGLVEHIVVDNCSDDATHDVLEKYPEIIAVIESDRGQSEALNKGFQKARGDWILWLNIDDFLCPGVMSRYLELVIDQGENFDMAYGHTVFVDADSRKIRTVFHPRWYYWMTKIGCYVAPSTGSLFRRSCLVENPLDESFHMVMDTEWMLRVGETLRVRRLAMEAVSFRLDDNKTADHIQSGILTPQHQKERNLLATQYPYYPGEDEPLGMIGNFFIRGLRKLTRLLILTDKFVCRSFSSSR